MRKFKVLTWLMAGLFVANPVFAQDKKQIETVVHDYIIQNPEVLIESLQSYQQKQMDQTRKIMEKTQENAPKFSSELFHQAKDPQAGNPKGSITVVEFFDYQCPHCIDMTPVIDSLVKRGDTRIIFKEFPIRGPSSEFASKAALAANQMGKYFEFHTALMQAKRPLTEEVILEAAKSVGLDIAQLKSLINSNEIKQQLEQNKQLAQKLQLLGTPAIFVAKSDVSTSTPATAIAFIPGVLTPDQMTEVIQKVKG